MLFLSSRTFSSSASASLIARLRSAFSDSKSPFSYFSSSISAMSKASFAAAMLVSFSSSLIDSDCIASASFPFASLISTSFCLISLSISVVSKAATLSPFLTSEPSSTINVILVRPGIWHLPKTVFWRGPGQSGWCRRSHCARSSR